VISDEGVGGVMGVSRGRGGFCMYERSATETSCSFGWDPGGCGRRRYIYASQLREEGGEGEKER